MNNIVIFGGTFDPVHNGHLTMAERAITELSAKQCIWVPNKRPLLKHDAQATTQQRLDMLQLAINQSPYHDKFAIDLCEVNRDSPSYMVDTLRYFRQKFGEQQSLSLLMGEDAFVQLSLWHEWESLINLAHFIVISRPAQSPLWPSEMTTLLRDHAQSDAVKLCQKPSGYIYQLPIEVDISSTNIREQLSERASLEKVCPKSVASYIQENKLYQ